MSKRWITYDTATGKAAEGQKPFPNHKQAKESADRVNAVLAASAREKRNVVQSLHDPPPQ